jgi:hypothetical protein
VSIPRSSAAGILGLDAGTQVRLRRLDGEGDGTEGISTPIELGRRSS